MWRRTRCNTDAPSFVATSSGKSPEGEPDGPTGGPQPRAFVRTNPPAGYPRGSRRWHERPRSCVASAETAEDNRLSCFARAIDAVRDARGAAEKLKDSRTVAWTHSFEAYCLRAQGRYGEAVSEQLIAVQLEERDPLDLYNLACYQALNGQPEQAKKTLELAIGSAGERYRRHAAGDPDLAEMRASGVLNELLKGVAAEEPEKSVPLVPGTQPNYAIRHRA